jgi:hypothetical protein
MLIQLICLKRSDITTRESEYELSKTIAKLKVSAAEKGSTTYIFVSACPFKWFLYWWVYSLCTVIMTFKEVQFSELSCIFTKKELMIHSHPRSGPNWQQLYTSRDKASQKRNWPLCARTNCRNTLPICRGDGGDGDGDTADLPSS